jgi:predicted DNA-binding transcriptional regulator YafY
MTAADLAEELEVSVRTIYRDIDALSAAGVPLYTDRGPGGGCSLLDSYRTNLTGLTQDEVQALFMLSIPSPLVDLGVSQELKTALLKLSAALPSTRRRAEERVRSRIHLDSTWWFQSGEPVPHLPTIQEAVWADRKLVVRYRLPFGGHIERRVDPYGLVAKAGVWYLVFGRGGTAHSVRVSEVLAARLEDAIFERPESFNLPRWWQGWCEAYEAGRRAYSVCLRVAPGLVPLLPMHFGHATRELVRRAEPPDEEGWLTLTLPFESLESARTRILGFGRAVEVVGPRALRESVRDHAAQIVDLYGQRGR